MVSESKTHRKGLIAAGYLFSHLLLIFWEQRKVICPLLPSCRRSIIAPEEHIISSIYCSECCRIICDLTRSSYSYPLYTYYMRAYIHAYCVTCLKSMRCDAPLEALFSSLDLTFRNNDGSSDGGGGGNNENAAKSAYSRSCQAG